MNRRQSCQRLLTLNLALAAATQTACGGGGPSLIETRKDLPTVSTFPPTYPHLDWTRQATIYEVNLRQFSTQGTFEAFEAHLPRLAQMGVDILWFMPIQPIGVEKRKGSLGSYYAVRDYTAVNPEFGTLDDFKRVVAAAQALGMKVILDWVANHTAWDHAWVAQHRQRYKLNSRGEVFSVTFNDGTPQVEYWDDVVGLNYESATAQQDLWPAMTQAMTWWLQEAGIDGFRCDVAGLVPTAFWEQARVALDAIKPVFMLAESDKTELLAKAFDMGYDWELQDQLRLIAKGQANAQALRAWGQRRQQRYPADSYAMNFTSNHDANSWFGHDAEVYGNVDRFKAMAVLAAMLPGMPLVYGGQESFFRKRLAFFEKDLIDWQAYPLTDFYAGLLALKHQHPALANGLPGNSLQWRTNGDDRLVVFERTAGSDRVSVAVNLSDQPLRATVAGADIDLPAWGWHIATA